MGLDLLGNLNELYEYKGMDFMLFGKRVLLGTFVINYERGLISRTAGLGHSYRYC
jgi:hypothetical protein